MGKDMDAHGPELAPDTRIVHLGEGDPILGAAAPPLFQTSTFLFETVEGLFDAMAERPAGPPYSYSKTGNPSLDLAERKIASLEGMDACKLVGCGNAALSMTIMAHTEAGSHVVLPDTAYFPVRHLLGDVLARYGVAHTLVDGRRIEDFADAVRPETTLIYLEAPSSMMMRMQDVPAVAKMAREKGIATMIDNTYNTPLHFNPAAHGVDVVCHSVTKYLGGHSDLTAGAILTDAARMDRIVRGEVNAFGAASPFVGWLVTRGLRTLSLRVKRVEATANAVAAWLEGRPEVARVHHLGLDSYPQRELVQTLLRGTTGLFSLGTRRPLARRGAGLRQPPDLVRSRRELGRPREPRPRRMGQDARWRARRRPDLLRPGGRGGPPPRPGAGSPEGVGGSLRVVPRYSNLINRYTSDSRTG